MSEQRAAENFDMINEEFFQHKRIPFEPFTTTENEIHIDEFGFD